MKLWRWKLHPSKVLDFYFFLSGICPVMLLVWFGIFRLVGKWGFPIVPFIVTCLCWVFCFWRVWCFDLGSRRTDVDRELEFDFFFLVDVHSDLFEMLTSILCLCVTLTCFNHFALCKVKNKKRGLSFWYLLQRLHVFLSDCDGWWRLNVHVERIVYT